MIVFTVKGQCVAKGRPKFSTVGGYPKAYTPAKTRDYENKVAQAFKDTGQKGYTDGEPLAVNITILLPVPKSYSKKKRAEIEEGKVQPTGRPDLDNYIKSILDGLNDSGAWKDDSQIVSIVAVKEYTFHEPLVYVQIDEYTQSYPF